MVKIKITPYDSIGLHYHMDWVNDIIRWDEYSTKTKERKEKRFI